jgi:hypothetical protein
MIFNLIDLYFEYMHIFWIDTHQYLFDISIKLAIFMRIKNSAYYAESCIL